MRQYARYEIERSENELMLNYEATVKENGNPCVVVPHAAGKISVLLAGKPLKLFHVIRKSADAYVS